MILRIALVTFVLFQSFNSHAVTYPTWKSIPAQDLVALNNKCSYNFVTDLGAQVAGISSIAVGGYSVVGAVWGLALGTGDYKGSADASLVVAILVGGASLVVGGNLVLMPFKKSDFVALVNDFENGLETPRVEAFRSTIEKSEITFDEGVAAINEMVLTNATNCFADQVVPEPKK